MALIAETGIERNLGQWQVSLSQPTPGKLDPLLAQEVRNRHSAEFAERPRDKRGVDANECGDVVQREMFREALPQQLLDGRNP